MKKKIILATLLAALVCSLTGCVNLNLEEKIAKDGKITDTIVMYLEKEAVKDYVVRKMGSDRVSQTEKELLKEGFSIQNIDGKEYYVSKPEVSRTTLVKQAKGNQSDTVKGGYEIWETGMRLNLGIVFDYLELSDYTSMAEAYELTESEMKEILGKSYIEYSVVFDYDILKTDKSGVIDSQNPKKATWKIKMSDMGKAPTIEAYCKSDIKVTGVTQNATYGKTKKVKFSGAKTAKYKGKKIKSGAKFKKHGQHTLILKAASGEQRTVTFFIDKKKPTITGVKNKKTYKGVQYFIVEDNDSGVASVTINGKKQQPEYGMYTVKKKGTNTIVVKDKVGNKKKIKVKISKKKKK